MKELAKIAQSLAIVVYQGQNRIKDNTPVKLQDLQEVAAFVENAFVPDDSYPKADELPGSVASTAKDILIRFHDKITGFLEGITERISAIDAAKQNATTDNENAGGADEFTSEQANSAQEKSGGESAQEDLEIVPTGLIDDLTHLLGDIATFCETLAIDANAQIAHLDDLEPHLAELLKKNASALARIKGDEDSKTTTKADIENAEEFARKLVNEIVANVHFDFERQPLLASLYVGKSEIEKRKDCYSIVKNVDNVLEFQRRRYTLDHEISLVPGTYGQDLLGAKGGVLLKKWGVWFLVFFALAINNYFIAPSLADLGGQRDTVLGVISNAMFGLKLFVVALVWIVPFAAVTFVPFVYMAAQSVLPDRSLGKDEYRRQSRRGIASIAISGCAGLLLVYLFSALMASQGYAYSLFLSKPPVVSPPFPTAEFHASPVYCAVTKSAVAGQPSWVFANDKHIETNTDDCRLVDPNGLFNYVVIVGTASQEETPNDGHEHMRALTRAEGVAKSIVAAIPEAERAALSAHVYVLSLGKHTAVGNQVTGLGDDTKDQRQILAFTGRSKVPPSISEVKPWLKAQLKSLIDLGGYTMEGCRFVRHDDHRELPDGSETSCEFLQEFLAKCPPSAPMAQIRG